MSGGTRGRNNKIYDVEAKGKAAKLAAPALQELRRREAASLVVDLLRMTSGWTKKYSLNGKMAEAMRYVRNQRPYLLAFLRDGRVPIDNNACERAIRPIAIGRNNWLFAGSENGGDTAAILFTIVESARAAGVDPQDYLLHLLLRSYRTAYCPTPARPRRRERASRGRSMDRSPVRCSPSAGWRVLSLPDYCATLPQRPHKCRKRHLLPGRRPSVHD